MPTGTWTGFLPRGPPLTKIILVEQLSPDSSNKQCWTPGVLLALRILSGYKDGLVLSGAASRRAGAFGSQHEGRNVALHRGAVQSTLLILGIVIFIAAGLHLDFQ